MTIARLRKGRQYPITPGNEKGFGSRGGKAAIKSLRFFRKTIAFLGYQWYNFFE